MNNLFFWHTKMLDTKCIVKYAAVKQSQTLHKYQRNWYNRENFDVHSSNYKFSQITILYRMFTECINRCDVGENFSNTKKPTIILLQEFHYISNYKFYTREILWRYTEKKHVYRLVKRFSNWIRKTPHFVQTWITPLQTTCQWVH
jgi:hypothetical protein